MSHDDLQTALDKLTQAHGSAALAAAFRGVQRTVRKSRQAEKVGGLATAIMESIRLRDEMKAGGMTGAALDRGLEAVLREVWPKPHGRTEPWHDQCGNCRDYGLEMLTCPGDATCGFLKTHGPHEYGRPCWCVKGNRFRGKPKQTPDDALALAAKQKKPSRFGR